MKPKKQKFVPLEKQSKRQQKEYYSSRRKNWGELNPVTRTTPNPKAYKRKKSGQRYEHEPLPGFLLFYQFNLLSIFTRIIPILKLSRCFRFR